MTKSFNLDVKALAACAPAMSDDETRYYLCGVHIFERDGIIIYEATNGHFLIQVMSELPQDEMDVSGINIILPDFIVMHLSKKPFLKGFAMLNDVPIPCVVDNLRINIEMIAGLINFKLVEGTYPDTIDVIPKKGSCKNLNFDAIGFMPGYMDKIGKSLKAYANLSFLSMRFSGSEGTEPVLVKSQNPNWLAVLMPARI